MYDTRNSQLAAPNAILTVVRVVICFAVLIFSAACQRRCQAPSTQTFRSVTETQWRLVETTDAKLLEDLDNFNFEILQFAANSTGAINRVVNNEQFETPIATIAWVPNTQAKSMRIQYTSVPVSTGENTTAPKAGDLGTFDYNYKLGRDLQMQELRTGNFYRYVPFTGVVSPDIDCTF